MHSPEHLLDPKLVPPGEKTVLVGAEAQALLQEFKRTLRARIPLKPTKKSTVMRGKHAETIRVFFPNNTTINFTQHIDEGTAQVTLHESYGHYGEHITRKETIRWAQEDRWTWIANWIPIARPTRMVAKSDVVMVFHHDADNERRPDNPPGIRKIADGMLSLLRQSNAL